MRSLFAAGVISVLALASAVAGRMLDGGWSGESSPMTYAVFAASGAAVLLVLAGWLLW